MKEYYIVYMLERQEKWELSSVIRRCNLTAKNIFRIEDEIRDELKVERVRILHFSELESSDDE